MQRSFNRGRTTFGRGRWGPIELVKHSRNGEKEVCPLMRRNNFFHLAAKSKVCDVTLRTGTKLGFRRAMLKIEILIKLTGQRISLLPSLIPEGASVLIAPPI